MPFLISAAGRRIIACGRPAQPFAHGDLPSSFLTGGADLNQTRPKDAERRPTRTVRCGDVTVGGQAPVSVQSMTKTSTEDVDATLAQIDDETVVDNIQDTEFTGHLQSLLGRLAGRQS